MRFGWQVILTLSAALSGCDDSPAPASSEIADIVVENATEEPGAGPIANRAANEAPATGAPAPPQEASPRSASGYRLIGTEPFWGGTVSPREIVYSTPENQAGERIFVTVRIEGGSEIYSGRLSGQPFTLVLTDGPCSDGMSDNVHAYTARLEVQGETRSGCANPQ